MVGFENYVAQMITKPRKCVLCKNNVTTSMVKFTVHTYSLCIGLNETYSCPAHNFVVGPASGMVGYKDLVFHPFVWSHQGAILLEALGGGIMSYGHIFFLVLLYFEKITLDFSCKDSLETSCLILSEKQ